MLAQSKKTNKQSGCEKQNLAHTAMKTNKKSFFHGFVQQKARFSLKLTRYKTN